MQPVQECMCRAVLFLRFCCNKYLGCLSYFIAFKVYIHEDIMQVSFIDNITDSQTDLKSLTCINGSFFVGSVFLHLTIEATSWLFHLSCAMDHRTSCLW